MDFRSSQGFLFFFGFLIVVAVCGFASTHRSENQDTAPVGKIDFGQFPANTEAERELAKMLCGKDEDIDLALANWLVVADIPQFAGVTRDKYFSQLNAMIDQVRQDIEKRREVAKSRGKDPDAADVRCSTFCGAILKLGFEYADDFRQHDLTPRQQQALHGDGNKIFLAGLLRTRRGSCVSMPLIYLVIGQRLGMPVHLVSIGQHYFIRWQEPGYRMNIETTIVDRVAVTPDDSVYLEDEGLTKDRLRGSDLRSLSNQEVLGQLLFTRSVYWVMSPEKSKTRSWVDLSRAFHLASDDPSIQKTHQAIFAHYGITPADTLLALQKKEENSAPPVSSEALPPPQAMRQLKQSPPSSMPQPQSFSRATPASLTRRQVRKIPNTTLPR